LDLSLVGYRSKNPAGWIARLVGVRCLGQCWATRGA
jgi:hypothetical protein